MSEVLKACIFGLVTFVIIYCGYYFGVLKRKFDLYNGKVKKKKSKKKINNGIDVMEFTYLASKFHLDPNKVNVLYCFKMIALLDALIISVTGTVIYYIPWNIIWKFLIGFVMLFALIYSVYEIFGRHLVKKGWSKNE